MKKSMFATLGILASMVSFSANADVLSWHVSINGQLLPAAVYTAADIDVGDVVSGVNGCFLVNSVDPDYFMFEEKGFLMVNQVAGTVDVSPVQCD